MNTQEEIYSEKLSEFVDLYDNYVLGKKKIDKWVIDRIIDIKESMIKAGLYDLLIKKGFLTKKAMEELFGLSKDGEDKDE